MGIANRKQEDAAIGQGIDDFIQKSDPAIGIGRTPQPSAAQRFVQRQLRFNAEHDVYRQDEPPFKPEFLKTQEEKDFDARMRRGYNENGPTAYSIEWAHNVLAHEKPGSRNYQGAVKVLRAAGLPIVGRASTKQSRKEAVANTKADFEVERIDAAKRNSLVANRGTEGYWTQFGRWVQSYSPTLHTTQQNEAVAALPRPTTREGLDAWRQQLLAAQAQVEGTAAANSGVPEILSNTGTGATGALAGVLESFSGGIVSPEWGFDASKRISALGTLPLAMATQGVALKGLGLTGRAAALARETGIPFAEALNSIRALEEAALAERAALPLGQRILEQGIETGGKNVAINAGYKAAGQFGSYTGLNKQPRKTADDFVRELVLESPGLFGAGVAGGSGNALASGLPEPWSKVVGATAGAAGGAGFDIALNRGFNPETTPMMAAMGAAGELMTPKPGAPNIERFIRPIDNSTVGTTEPAAVRRISPRFGEFAGQEFDVVGEGTDAKGRPQVTVDTPKGRRTYVSFKEIPNDTQDQSGVRSSVAQGQTPVEANVIQSGGDASLASGRVLQEHGQGEIGGTAAHDVSQQRLPVEAISRAFPGVTIENTPDGHILTGENGVKVELRYDNEIRPDQAALKAGHGEEANHEFVPSVVVFGENGKPLTTSDALIKLATGPTRENSAEEWHLHHEAYHVVKELILTDYQKEELAKQFPNEEAEANGYADWRNYRRTDTPEGGIFSKIHRFVKDLLARTIGFVVKDDEGNKIGRLKLSPTNDATFRAMERGSAWSADRSRTPAEIPSTPVPVQEQSPVEAPVEAPKSQIRPYTEGEKTGTDESIVTLKDGSKWVAPKGMNPAVRGKLIRQYRADNAQPTPGQAEEHPDTWSIEGRDIPHEFAGRALMRMSGMPVIEFDGSSLVTKDGGRIPWSTVTDTIIKEWDATQKPIEEKPNSTVKQVTNDGSIEDLKLQLKRAHAKVRGLAEMEDGSAGWKKRYDAAIEKEIELISKLDELEPGVNHQEDWFKYATRKSQGGKDLPEEEELSKISKEITIEDTMKDEGSYQQIWLGRDGAMFLSDTVHEDTARRALGGLGEDVNKYIDYADMGGYSYSDDLGERGLVRLDVTPNAIYVQTFTDRLTPQQIATIRQLHSRPGQNDFLWENQEEWDPSHQEDASKGFRDFMNSDLVKRSAGSEKYATRTRRKFDIEDYLSEHVGQIEKGAEMFEPSIIGRDGIIYKLDPKDGGYHEETLMRVRQGLGLDVYPYGENVAETVREDGIVRMNPWMDRLNVTLNDRPTATQIRHVLDVTKEVGALDYDIMHDDGSVTSGEGIREFRNESAVRTALANEWTGPVTAGEIKYATRKAKDAGLSVDNLEKLSEEVQKKENVSKRDADGAIWTTILRGFAQHHDRKNYRDINFDFIERRLGEWLDEEVDSRVDEFNSNTYDSISPDHVILYRTARNPNETYKILVAFGNKDLSEAWDTSQSGIYKYSEDKNVKRAMESGANVIFTTPSPTVSSFYEGHHASLPVTFALEVPKDAVLSGTRQGKDILNVASGDKEFSHSLASSMGYVDAEILIDTRKITNIWRVPRSRVAEAAALHRGLAGDRFGASVDARRQAVSVIKKVMSGYSDLSKVTPEQVRVDIAAELSLLSGGRPIPDLLKSIIKLDLPSVIDAKQASVGLLLDKALHSKSGLFFADTPKGVVAIGDKLLLRTGEVVPVASIAEYKPHEIYQLPEGTKYTFGMNDPNSKSGKRLQKRMYGLFDQRQIPDTLIERIVKPGEPVSMKERNEVRLRNAEELVRWSESIRERAQQSDNPMDLRLAKNADVFRGNILGLDDPRMEETRRQIDEKIVNPPPMEPEPARYGNATYKFEDGTKIIPQDLIGLRDGKKLFSVHFLGNAQKETDMYRSFDYWMDPNTPIRDVYSKAWQEIKDTWGNQNHDHGEYHGRDLKFATRKRTNYAGNLNLDTIPDQDIRDYLKAEATRLAPEIEKRRRGKVSWEQTENEAEALGLDQKQIERMKEGYAANAQEQHGIVSFLEVMSLEAKKTADNYIKDQTPENYLKAVEARQAAETGLLAINGVLAESGRALNYAKRVKQILMSTQNMPDEYKRKAEQRLKDMFKDDQAALDAKMKALAAIPNNDHEAIFRFLRDERKMNLSEKVYTYWIGNILSGIGTQERNALGNLIWATALMAERVPRGAVDAVRSKLTGTEREYYAGEVVPAAYAYFRGVPLGFRRALETFLKGYSINDVEDLNHIGRELGGGLKNPNNWMKRLLGAVDAFNRSTDVESEKAAIGYRQARKEGLTGRAAVDRAIQLAASPTLEMMDEAVAHGHVSVFTESSRVSRALMSLRKEMSGLKWILLFVQVPTNVLRRGVEYSPIGLGNTVRRAAFDKDFRGNAREQSQTTTRALLGSMVFVTGLSLAAQGRLVGNAPKDEKERDAFYRAGKKPFSVLIGNKYVPIQVLGPLAIPLSMAAFTHEDIGNITTAKDYKELENRVVAALFDIPQFAVNATYLRGVSDFFNAIDQPEVYGKRLIANTATGFIPNSSMLREFAQAGDDTMRSPQTIAEQIMYNVPGLRNKLTPRQDAWGNDVKTPSGIAAFAPAKYGVKSEDPVDAEFGRLGIAPVQADGYRVKGETLPLTSIQVYNLKRRTGAAARKAAEEYIGSSRYQMEDDEERKKQLNQRMQSAVDKAKNDFYTSVLESTYGPRPGSRPKLRTGRSLRIGR